LILGLLKQYNTVEDKNTESGKVVAEKVKSGEITKDEADKELSSAKVDNFRELIESKKIGYLALLRNLSNIVKLNDVKLINQACELLVVPEFIKKSLVFPHQIDLALEFLLTEYSNSQLSELIVALNTAYELSIPNLEGFFEGTTAVVLDTSGSMTSCVTLTNNSRSKDSAINKGALISATLVKFTNADMYQFATLTKSIKVNPLDSINTIKNRIKSEQGNAGGSTEFSTIFPELKKRYDRVFIISDLQGKDTVMSYFKEYEKKFGQSYVYAINLCGYPTEMFNSNHPRVFGIDGYTANIYELSKKVEFDAKVALNEIKKINI
jgi:hypothetical protein